MAIGTGLLAAHAILTTFGFVGLLATNLSVLLACRDGDAGAIARAIRTWRSGAALFGPVLGIGTLLGFALAPQLSISLASHWLLGAYVLALVAIAAQTAIMIPWQLRAARAADAGVVVPVRNVAVVVAVFTAAYAGIMLLMLLRP